MQQTLEKNSIELINLLSKFNKYDETLKLHKRMIVNALKLGGKVILAGNGGSCADCQHIAGEFVGRFLFERDGLPAISLTADTAILTCIGNDYGFDKIFSRQIQSLYSKNDLVWMLSTSGNSENLLNLANYCLENNCAMMSFLGKDGGELANVCEASLVVESHETTRIQEMHIFLAHTLIQEIEIELKNE